jgi:ornithine cyclodeaminase/alanine dehydrogenase-like protein (mu-crystallin family)
MAHAAGCRSYDTFDRDRGDQLVALHDWHTGSIEAVAVGSLLGRRRVGAIGAVALRVLARADAASLGLVGAGVQAWQQLWAMSVVRRFADVRVFSRDAARRTAFARRAASELGLRSRAVGSAREAVREADVVVLATSSATPVVDTDWIENGCFVTTIGPKQVGRAEFGPDLVDRADVVVTDSPGQIEAYDPPNVLAGTPQGQRLVHLGAVLSGDRPGRQAADQTTLFCSVGLAGTEVFLLDRLLRRLRTLAADHAGEAQSAADDQTSARPT